MQYDVFISHSSIDKDDVARPLAEALQEHGLSVWLDEEQLHIGDSINRDIGEALHKSRFVIVILSPAYLESEWGQKELDAAFTKEKHAPKTILPIYHHVDVADVERHWTFLADKIALTTDDSPEILADKIQASITRIKGESTQATSIKRTPLWKRKSVISGFALSVAASIVAAVIMMPWASDGSSGDNQSISIGGNVENSTIAPTIIEGDQINNHIDEEALARRLVEKMGLPSGDTLQQKDEEINRLTETITRLQQDPANEFKQAALKKLEEDKPQEATALLEKSIAERAKAREELDRQEARDWVDIGNIAYLTDTQKALKAYQKAVVLDAGNIEAWNRLGSIYVRLGKLDDAIQSYETVESLASDDQAWQAKAYGNLGIIYFARGDLDKAEAFYLKALKVDEVLGRQEGMAAGYGNIGMIYFTRGDLDKAEAFYFKALKVDEVLGFQEGMSNQYGNLGAVYFMRGNLGDAERFFIKSFNINEMLGHQEGMASDYGNLGLIYRRRGELDKAEEFQLKSLDIEKTLGRQKGMASGYGNLGLIYGARGDLDKAEEFLLKSLNINEALGFQEGVANQYGNLGLIYKHRGDMPSACEHWRTSVGIYNKMGAATTNQVQSWIDADCK